MKKYSKVILVLGLFLSFSLYNQSLDNQEIKKFHDVQKNQNQYENKRLQNLLQDLPEVKMLRIMPNNPTPNVLTFIIGFVCNKQFSRSPNKKNNAFCKR